MIGLRRVRRPPPRDVLATTVTLLEALDTASDAISAAVPLFGIIVRSALGLTKMLEVPSYLPTTTKRDYFHTNAPNVESRGKPGGIRSVGRPRGFGPRTHSEANQSRRLRDRGRYYAEP